MTPEKIIEELSNYRDELGLILGRFTRTEDGRNSRISIDPEDNYRFRTIVTEVSDLLRDHIPGSQQHTRLIANSYNEGVSNMLRSSSYASVKEVSEAISAVVKRVDRNRGILENVPGPLDVSTNRAFLMNALENIVLKLHPVVVQLRSRHDNRDTLDVTDEYDVQDLFHSLLRLYFSDVRPEEWTPSYAGSSSRTDFLLPQIDTVVEIKKTRKGLNAKSLGEQLIIDISKYKTHPNCGHLICCVYDPEGRIANPAGIESDLNDTSEQFDTRVFIVPKLV